MTRSQRRKMELILKLDAELQMRLAKDPSGTHMSHAQYLEELRRDLDEHNERIRRQKEIKKAERERMHHRTLNHQDWGAF